MRLFRDRQLAQIAASNLIRRRQNFREQTEWLHVGEARHRPALLVGGGLLAGWLFGRLSISRAVRKAGAALSLGFALMRTPLGPLALAMLFGRRRGQRNPAASTEPQG